MLMARKREDAHPSSDVDSQSYPKSTMGGSPGLAALCTLRLKIGVATRLFDAIVTTNPDEDVALHVFEAEITLKYLRLSY
jgi:hypothetical protein